METKYPEIEVQLSYEDGNAFFIMGRVGKAMKQAGLTQADVNDYMEEAMSGDYDNVIQTTMRWVSVY